MMKVDGLVKSPGNLMQDTMLGMPGSGMPTTKLSQMNFSVTFLRNFTINNLKRAFQQVLSNLNGGMK